VISEFFRYKEQDRTEQMLAREKKSEHQQANGLAPFVPFTPKFKLLRRERGAGVRSSDVFVPMRNA
jgi:hypothetical protein